MRAGWVWAPKAQRVELLLFEREAVEFEDQNAIATLALEARGGGWWGAEQALPAGTLYGFSLDGGAPLPDPRSQFQPFGLPGPSQVVDHSAFVWEARGYSPPDLSRAVFYELHVGTFSASGNYRGVEQRLDHLQQLGITHLELMPVHQFPGRYGWGYDGVQPFAPFHHYGRPDDLKKLVDSCHARGMAVILDVVYNHVGPEQNTLTQFAPYLRTGARTPWGHGYNLDARHSQEVRRFLLDNARMWLEDYHFDGLRLDAVHSIEDASDRHLLDELGELTREQGRKRGQPLYLFAEAEARRPDLTTPLQRGGRALDAQWDDDLHYCMVGTLSRERAGHYGRVRGLKKLADALLGHPLRAAAGPQRQYSVPAQRLITCIQNHDRIGNRPDGQRFGVEPGPELDQLAALLMFTSALRPLLFMGQEWGTHCRFYYFTDHQRSELIRSVRRGRAREMKAFGWKTTCPVPPDSPRAFEASRLTWGELEASGHRNVLCFYTRLIALRKAFDELGHTPAMTLDPSTGVLRMRRPKTRVFANLGKHSRRFRIEPGSRLLLASRDGVTSRSRDVELPPMTACLIERGQPGQSPRAGTKSRKRS